MPELYRRGITRSPLKAAGVMLGVGLGGFLDGILFHELLQTHSMLSAKLPMNSLESVHSNLFWGGIFQAFTWIMTILGLITLWRAGKRADVPWRRNALLGSMAVGWGFFQLAEGLVLHYVLELHHVVESAGTGTQALWDALLLLFGVALLGGGLWLIGKDDREARGQRTDNVTTLRPPQAM